MNLRKSPPAETAAPAEETTLATSAASKGRPTPKRRDATGPRGPVSAPKTRKEAMARQKQLAKEAKTKRATDRASIANMSATERRAALRRGDPGVLPRRDQGKTKALARDWVDSHRMMSNYLLFLFVVMIAGAFMPVLSIVTIALFAALLVEWYLVGRKIRKLAIERFDKAEGTNLSIGFYAGSRAYLPRRWRLPAPRVERGEEI